MTQHKRSSTWAYFEIEDSKKIPLTRILQMRSELEIDPTYQRQGGIWDSDKQRYLIDTVLNRFVIPPIYLHEYLKPISKENRIKRYAVVDGKQRLETLWAFMDGRLTLAKDFEYYDDETVELAGKSYQELALLYPEIRGKFDKSSLAVTFVKTGEIDVIEELFLRLNEASTLNAAEKRNAFGGHLVPKIRELASHRYFSTIVPYDNKRYRHREQAAKFLMLEDRRQACDLKKDDLDRFTKSFTEKGKRTLVEAEAVFSRASITLDLMSNFFTQRDALLGGVGVNSVYYLLFLQRKLGEWIEPRFTHQSLEDFEAVRAANTQRARKREEDANLDLLEYDSYSQRNDEASYRVRARIIKDFMKGYTISDRGRRYLGTSQIS